MQSGVINNRCGLKTNRKLNIKKNYFKIKRSKANFANNPTRNRKCVLLVEKPKLKQTETDLLKSKLKLS